jgi:hypothetical protein
MRIWFVVHGTAATGMESTMQKYAPAAVLSFSRRIRVREAA